MSTALQERPSVMEPSAGGGGSGRRAIARWAWRLFRREWRQQILVLALVTLAVAATTVGVTLASNVAQPLDATFGTANSSMTFSGADHADVAAAQKAFGPIEEIAHQSIPIPGSQSTLDVRAQDPNGKYGHPTLRLLSGRYPAGAGDIAMTKAAAATFNLHIGSRFVENGRSRRLVGLVENPLDLHDDFALVAPGQADPPQQVTILFDAPQRKVTAFHPSGDATSISTRGSVDTTAAAMVVLVLETIGLLFVGLVAAAGFAVMAQRRLRALGMLGALGATDRQVRFAMVANGAVVGVVAAVTGAVAGFATFVVLGPRFEKLVHHRVDRFALPWWAIAAAMLLAIVTAVIAAWWPARSVSRAPIVAALSARPSPPKPAHRFAALGGVFLAAGLACLAFAHPEGADPKPALIIGGTIATTFGMLFLGPIFIRVLAAAGRRAPIALRLPLRDLARYQARSAAALGAISLALAIAATIAVSASANAVPTASPNLAANQLIVHLGVSSDVETVDAAQAIPVSTASEIAAIQTRVSALAATLHAQADIPLTEAFDPTSGTFDIGNPAPQGGGGGGGGSVRISVVGTPGQSTGGTPARVPVALARLTVVHRGRQSGIRVDDGTALYLATPALLKHYGLTAGDIDANRDIISGRTDLAGLVVIGKDNGPTPCDATQPGCRVNGVKPNAGAAPRGPYVLHPKIQAVKLPTYTSAPDTLLTAHALHAFGLEPVPAGWLIETGAPLTASQINAARSAAAAAGATVETRKSPASYGRVRDWATGIGLLVALGVLAMTVGLIRSETANELRTLAATGATSTTRRTLTGATAGALAFLGALLGTGGAYLALLAWHRSDLHPLTRVPYLNLAVIIVGLPVIAITAGWLLAGREPATIAHRPLE